MFLTAYALIIALAPFTFAAGDLPKEVQIFLPEPQNYKKDYLAAAQKLKKADALAKAGKFGEAESLLKGAPESGTLSSHVTYALGRWHQKQNHYAKSLQHLNKLALSVNPYTDAAKDLLPELECQLALQGSKEKKKASGKIAQELFHCLEQASWRDWPRLEEQADALFEILSAKKDPLLGPFVAELIQAMPSSSVLRAKIVKTIPATVLEKYATPAKYKSKWVAAAGVKAVNPDADLFDQGMQLVLETKYSDANDIFKKFLSDFPQSEHAERAQFWIARTEEKMGNLDAAKTRFEQIWNDSPLSYYGLQAALFLKRDIKATIVPADTKLLPMEGTPIARHALSLWRIRALLEEGLLEYASQEAQYLFQNKPGGFGFGQENPDLVLLAAYLFHSAGYPLGAFAHAYTSISLDNTKMNNFSLGMLFPDFFRKEFEQASAVTQVSPLLLRSVSKQESAFLPNAVSRADALGLMQLLLSTAKDVDSAVTKDDLFTPARNVDIGSKYLQKLLERFQGNIALALAGYNAGPSRAASWQKKLSESTLMKEKFDVDAFIDTIPFTETRKYVGAILRNYAWYKLLENDGKVESIQELVFEWQKKAPTNPSP